MNEERIKQIVAIKSAIWDEHSNDPTSSLIVEKYNNNSVKHFLSKYEQQSQSMEKEKHETLKLATSSMQADIEINLSNKDRQIHLNANPSNDKHSTSLIQQEVQDISQKMKMKQSLNEQSIGSIDINYKVLNLYEKPQNDKKTNKIMQKIFKRPFTNNNKKSRPRKGLTTQSYAQKIWKQQTNSHIHKNLESKIRTIIKNGLNRIQNKKSQLLENKKNLNQTQLNDFIKNSGLRKDQWEKVLDLPSIYMQINIPNSKLGTSRFFKDKPPELKKFLQNLGKKILKIIIRSVRRMIFKCLDGEDIVQYLDEQANKELYELDDFCLQYKSIVVTSLMSMAKLHNYEMNEDQPQHKKDNTNKKFNHLFQSKSKEDIKQENQRSNAHWEVKLVDIQEELQSEKSSIQEQQNQKSVEKQSESILQFEAFTLPQQLKRQLTPLPQKPNLHLSDSRASTYIDNFNKKSNFPSNQKGEVNCNMSRHDSFQVVDECQRQ